MVLSGRKDDLSHIICRLRLHLHAPAIGFQLWAMEDNSALRVGLNYLHLRWQYEDIMPFLEAVEIPIRLNARRKSASLK